MFGYAWFESSFLFWILTSMSLLPLTTHPPLHLTSLTTLALLFFCSSLMQYYHTGRLYWRLSHTFLSLQSWLPSLASFSLPSKTISPRPSTNTSSVILVAALHQKFAPTLSVYFFLYAYIISFVIRFYHPSLSSPSLCRLFFPSFPISSTHSDRCVASPVNHRIQNPP